MRNEENRVMRDDIIISEPKNGWVSIKIKEFESEASYLVDIPFDWLRSCLAAFETRTPVSLFIDEEGSECFITSYYDVTHIVIDRDEETELITYRDIDFFDITDALIYYIGKYFDQWAEWDPYHDSDEEISQRKILLKKLISDVEEAMRPEKERYNKK